MTSSPLPILSAVSAAISDAVPLVVATAYLTPMNFAHRFSNRSTSPRQPSALRPYRKMNPPLMTRAIASISGRPIAYAMGGLYGRGPPPHVRRDLGHGRGPDLVPPGGQSGAQRVQRVRPGHVVS